MRKHSEYQVNRLNIKIDECHFLNRVSPLNKNKFYLDIENHHISVRIEEKIKELGGCVEFFLTEDVTHLITDKQVYQDALVQIPKIDHLLQSSSNFCTTTSLGNNSSRKIKPIIKSRADAMLSRARQGATNSFDKEYFKQKNLIQAAKSLDITIWHTTYAIEYFEKLYSLTNRYLSANVQQSRKLRDGVKILKNNYIKIELTHSRCRPYYYNLKGNWPRINIYSDFELFGDIDLLEYAHTIMKKHLDTINKKKFEVLKKKEQIIMTRKNRPRYNRDKQNVKIDSEEQSGFCEICRIEYDELKIHLNTDRHLNFIKNDGNFIALDTLIRSSTNIDKFLSINNKDLFKNNSCKLFTKRTANGKYINKLKSSTILNLSSPTLKTSVEPETNIFRRTRQSIISQSCIQNEDRKEESECSRISRERRKSVKKINYAEIKEEDEYSHDDSNSRTQRRRKNLKLRERDIKKSSVFSDSIKTKETSPLLYKVVETNTDIDNNDRKEPLSEKNIEQTTPIVVKFRKVRQTEVSILSGEAENFMFPKKNDVLSDIECQTTDTYILPSNINANDKLSIKRKSSLSTCAASESTQICKKRRTSRLTLHSRIKKTPEKIGILSKEILSIPNQIQEKKIFEGHERNDIDSIKKESPSEDRMNNLKYIATNKFSKYKFVFEKVPLNESWHSVFQRQDESQEKMFEYYGSTVYRKLPYEIGPLPFTARQCCELCICNCINERSQNYKSSGLNGQRLDRNKINDDIIQNQIDICQKQINEREASKSAALLALEMPRKSPREHASTLAILSCLIQQKEEKLNAHIATIIGQSEATKYQESLKNDIAVRVNGNVKRLRRNKCFVSKLKSRTIPNDSVKTMNSESKPKQHKKPLEFDMKESNLHPTFENHIDVNGLNKEIDDYLSQSLNNCTDLEVIPFVPIDTVYPFSADVELDDMLTDNCNKIIANNRLRLFKNLSSNKKRKNNKTGWPKKKKLIPRQQNLKMSNLGRISKTEPLSNHDQHCTTAPISDISNSSLVFKEDIYTCPYLPINEKPENYDIFTVSSDSLDTVLDAGNHKIKIEDKRNNITKKKCNEPLGIDQDSTNIENVIKKEENFKKTNRNNQSSDHETARELNISKLNTSQSSGSFTPPCEVAIYKSVINVSNESKSPPISPKKLRNPRGRWYRER